MPLELLTVPADVAGAPMERLAATWNALTGRKIKKFENRAIGERKVREALEAASAEDLRDLEATNLVNRGEPLPISVRAEPDQKEVEVPVPAGLVIGDVNASGMIRVEAPAVLVVHSPNGSRVVTLEAPREEGEASVNPFKPGTLPHGLWAACHASKWAPISSMPGKRGRPKTSPFVSVKYTGAGNLRLQAGSGRSKVLAVVKAAENQTATLAEIDAALGRECRGYVQKLIDSGFLVRVETDAAAAN